MTEELGSDYLWNRAGVPDDDLLQLEQLLARYRCPVQPPQRFDNDNDEERSVPHEGGAGG